MHVAANDQDANPLRDVIAINLDIGRASETERCAASGGDPHARRRRQS
jgi:hypothetical protein